MKTEIEVLRNARRNVLKMIENLSLEQLNKIPDDFSGNIAWHIGHLVATQQGLIYGISGNQIQLERSFIDKYKKGTKPQESIDQEQLDFIKSELTLQPERLEKDIEKNLFQNYTPYTTSFGNTITNLQEAVSFNNVHEGMHIGYIMALKHLV